MTTGARHEPLRVDFFLSSPICLGQYEYVRLDGVVAHLRSRLADPVAHRNRPSESVERSYLDGMRAIYHRGVYHASVGLLDSDEPPNPLMPVGSVPGSDGTIYKRLETGMLCDARLAKMSSWKHTPGTGHFKHAAIRLSVHPVRRVRFYARADEGMLRELLGGLRSLGKKTNIGYGQIESYEVERVPDDRSVVWKGRAMRSMPLELLESWEMVEWLCWHPPYWDAAGARECAPPGARVVLKSGNQIRRAEPALSCRP